MSLLKKVVVALYSDVLSALPLALAIAISASPAITEVSVRHVTD